MRLIFVLSGVGRKFSVIPLFLNLGSGLALLSLSTLTVDFILIYILKHKTYYRDVKIKNVEDKNKSLFGITESDRDAENSGERVSLLG